MERFLKSRYKIGEQIGESPFSITYRGTLLGGERPLIIKIYKRSVLNSQLIKDVKSKVRALKDIKHHGIAKMLDGDYGWQGFYFVREFVEGKSLAEVLEIKEPLETSKAVKIITSVCEALLPAHEIGIVHGALKPRNIFLSGGGSVKVADFVVYGALKTGAPQTTLSVVGDSLWLSPEEIHGEAPGRASDIYMLGVIFYQMLTSRHPFEGRALSPAIQHIKAPPKPPRQFNLAIPSHIEDIIIKSMEKDPMLRFGSVHEFLDSLRSKAVIDRGSSIYIPEISLDRPIEEAEQKEQAARKKTSRLVFWLALMLLGALLTAVWYAVFSSAAFK